MNHDYLATLDRIRSAPVPARTETYSPIPHSLFIENLQNKIIHSGFLLGNQRLYSNLLGTRLVGFIDVKSADQDLSDFGMNLSLGFKNSYDKSMSAAIVLGATVAICTNGVIAGDLIAFKRKHTGTVLEEVNEKINEAILQIRNVFARLVSDAKIMANYQLTQRQKSEILGIMYFEEDIVTPTQLSIVKKELESSEMFKGDSLWDLYNHITVALKTSHVTNYVDDHIRLHDFMSGIAGISHNLEQTPLILPETVNQ